MSSTNSIGNEIHATSKPDIAKPVLRGLVDVRHEVDPTRPVTQALFRPNVSGDYQNGLADMLDVIGTNYHDKDLPGAWKDKSGRKIAGTEQGHERPSRLACRDNPRHSGQFLWCGIDCLGESRRWPPTVFNGGLLDNKRASEVCAAILPGEIVVFDKAYVDFDHLFEQNHRGVWWVTRAKDNMKFRVVKNHTRGHDNIINDQIIAQQGKHKGMILRRVEAWMEVDDAWRVLVFITNNTECGPRSWCDLYGRPVTSKWSSRASSSAASSVTVPVR